MNQDIIPNFAPGHLYAETLILLRTTTPEGASAVYGQIMAHYPTAMDGNPDFDGPRQPIFEGRINLHVTTTKGVGMIPLNFKIPTTDPVEAAQLFKEFALKAIEDYKSAAFRQNLVVPPGVVKS